MILILLIKLFRSGIYQKEEEPVAKWIQLIFIFMLVLILVHFFHAANILRESMLTGKF
ncbi:MAG: hypothetical protein K8R21_13300 [Leptospira sp.]|nr:hypothetical protein [Leptospira sp.]